MSYQVTARKWRPQNFDEVVFQDHVSKTLCNSIINKRISHAYIFSGPRGVGKTTMARILAKAVNCFEGPTSTPCDKCENCGEIKSGASFDVIEIDGASNRGIDDIRELRENVNFAPVKSRYKVYIIDEVHMLTKEAFNALLKTLEEPPSHVIFIFATTEIHQIPDTILSRCQKFFFKKIPIEPIVDQLKIIVDKEGFKITENALYPIARAAEGSMRDAQSLLDQVISFSDITENSKIKVEINEEDALSILGIVPVESYIRQLDNIININPVAAMEEVNRVVTMGVDIKRYIAGFIDILRTIRLIGNGISVHEILGLSILEVEQLKKISDQFFDEELKAIFKISSDVYTDIKYSGNERVNLEMAILDMISIRKMPSISSIISKLSSSSEDSHKVKKNINKKSTSLKPGLHEDVSENETVDSESQTFSQDELNDKTEITSKVVSEKWIEFLNNIKEKKQYLHFILKPSKVLLKGSTLSISYPGGTDHTYYRKILDGNNQDFIREEMSKKLGVDVNITIGEVSNGDEKSNYETRDISKNDSIQNYPENSELIPGPQEEMLKSLEVEDFDKSSPAVEKLKNIFHGEIIKKGDK